jgi:serine/threonine-protein kinase
MIEIGSYIGGKYKLLNVISGDEGGMSTVYLALDEKLNKTWAIKVAQRNGVQDDNKAIQGLVADKDTLINLEHKYLPRIVDVFEDENYMMLVMDFIAGKSLQYWTQNNGARPQKDVIKWAKQLCDVIGYLHSNGIIYRDLKPSNIMLNQNDDITLIDFGTARQFERIKNTVSLGTVGYAAPEQFVDSDMGQVDARTDIYCIGATLHHLITGIDPQLNPTFVKKPIRDANPRLSEGLESIIVKCLQDEQSARYQSCAEFMVDLEHYEEIGSTIRRKNRNKIMMFALSLFMVVVFAMTSVFAYAAAENKLQQDYNLILQKASNPQLPQEDREKFYIDAFEIIGYRADAYLGLIEMFLSSDEANGTLSRSEVAMIRQIENGMNTESNGGYADTIYPLAALEQRDKAGYERVCYETGLAFWYDYEVESDRHSSAAGWFERAKPSFPIAQTYVNIGKFEKETQRFQGQNRTEQMYEAYENLWKALVTLKGDAAALNDNDMKLLIWREIINNVSDKASHFLARVGKSDILTLLGEIAAEAEKLKNETNLNAIKSIIGVDPAAFSGNQAENKGSLLYDIHEAKIKINSVRD